MADVAGVVIFALLLSKDRWRLVRSLGIRFAPPIACYLLLDRIYHWFRFGSSTGTYMGFYGEQVRQLNPWLPPSFPFNGAFVRGFLGVFFSPAKSIFIYDPLLLLTAGVVIWQLRRLTPLSRAYLIAMSLILIATAAGYAKYYNWDGEACWGNRFTTTPVFGMALLAVPLALRTRLPKAAIIGFVALACCIQASSLIFPSWVELVQNGRGQERFVLLPGCLHSTEYFVAGERMRNIWFWATTGGIAATCDGQSTGNPPLSLWLLLPLKTVSAEVRLLVRGSWLLIFSVMLVCAWKAITPRPLRWRGWFASE